MLTEGARGSLGRVIPHVSMDVQSLSKGVEMAAELTAVFWVVGAYSVVVLTSVYTLVTDRRKRRFIQ